MLLLVEPWDWWFQLGIDTREGSASLAGPVWLTHDARLVLGGPGCPWLSDQCCPLVVARVPVLGGQGVGQGAESLLRASDQPLGWRLSGPVGRRGWPAER